MKNKSGFTLIEVLVVALILSFTFAALMLVLSTGQRAWFTTDVSTQLRQNMIQALMRMDKELLSTRPSVTNLPADTASDTITFSVPNDNLGLGSVLDATGNIQWSTPITYSLDGTDLIRTQDGADIVLCHNVSVLTFTRSGNNLIQIDITVQKRDNANRLISDVEQSIIRMRN